MTRIRKAEQDRPGSGGSFPPLSIGFNLRQTSAFVTDIAPDVWIDPSITTPQTFGSLTVTVNLDLFTADRTRNRDNLIDARLAGLWFTSVGQVAATITVDGLPSGTYALRIAAGDTAGAQRAYCTFLDGDTPRVSLDAATAAGEFCDAAGVVRTAAAWPGSNTAVTITIASGNLIVNVDVHAVFTSVLAHFSLERLS